MSYGHSRKCCLRFEAVWRAKPQMWQIDPYHDEPYPCLAVPVTWSWTETEQNRASPYNSPCVSTLTSLHLHLFIFFFSTAFFLFHRKIKCHCLCNPGLIYAFIMKELACLCFCDKELWWKMACMNWNAVAPMVSEKHWE